MAVSSRPSVELEHFQVRSGRANLSVSIAGEGRLVVMLHAGVCDRRMWWSQLSAFSKNFQVAAFDRRGFGDTSYVPESHSSVRDLDAVMEALEADSAILVGCSQGGRVAVDYALTHPDRVDGLVLVSPAISGANKGEEYPEDIQRLMDEIELATKAGDLEWLNRLEAHAWLDGPAQREGRVGGNVRVLFMDMNSTALRSPEPGRQSGHTDAMRRFGDIRQPVEFISGEFDFPHINARSEALARSNKRAHLTVMKGVAHLPSLEQPAQFNTVLKRALKGM
jgi:pimeloyl-ACP methyl ester carboxylesterase